MSDASANPPPPQGVQNAMDLPQFHQEPDLSTERTVMFSGRHLSWVKETSWSRDAQQVMANLQEINDWVCGQGMRQLQKILQENINKHGEPEFPFKKDSYNSVGRLLSLCHALGLSEDPHLWTEAQCKTFLLEGVNSNWFTLREQFKASSSEGKAVLSRMVAFRKYYVDNLVGRLSQQYPGIQAFSVGSKGLESDYDLTLGMSGDLKQDVQAVRVFNRTIREEFGKAPGIVFDVNMYVQDHITLSENIDSTREGEPIEGSQSPGALMRGMSLEDQDVMALMKQRRFMREDEWGAYVDCLAAKVKDLQQKSLLRKQYDEADANYRISVAQILEMLKAREIDPPSIDLTPEEEVRVNTFVQHLAPTLSSSVKDNAKNIFKEELLNAKRMACIIEHHSEALLEVCNKLYLDKMQQARDLQQQLASLNGSDTRELMAKSEVLKAQVKRVMGEALFFANEAYQSEGAVLHVVMGSQGGQFEAMVEKLSPAQVLHSHNEQLGDLLKDIHHYSEKGVSGGVLCYRCSKYLSRLLETVAILKHKNIIDSIDFEKEYGTIEKLKERIDGGLLRLRKGKVAFSTEALKENYALGEMQQLFKIPLEQPLAEVFKKRILTLALEVNAATRLHEACLGEQPTEADQQLYFQNRVIKKRS